MLGQSERHLRPTDSRILICFFHGALTQRLPLYPKHVDMVAAEVRHARICLQTIGTFASSAIVGEVYMSRFCVRACNRVLVVTALVMVWAASSAWAGTLDDVRARGVLRCGANQIVGQATLQDDGRWSGFMADICRAVAAAVLGDSERFEIITIEGQTRFPALLEGDVDLLTEGTTWTLGRDSDLGLNFPGVYFYDGQGFLAAKSLGVNSLNDIKSARICVVRATTTLVNLENLVASRKLPVEILILESDDGAWDSFLKGRCEIFTNDLSSLATRRALHTANPDDFVLLPEVVSKEPLGPVVRSDDPQWFEIVRWVLFALIAAEEYNVTSQNINDRVDTIDPQIGALRGLTDDHAAALGLEPGWMKRIVAQVGNYQEIYDRNYGATTKMNIARGLNALWRDGGLMYAPPLQ